MSFKPNKANLAKRVFSGNVCFKTNIQRCFFLARDFSDKPQCILFNQPLQVAYITEAFRCEKCRAKY